MMEVINDPNWLYSPRTRRLVSIWIISALGQEQVVEDAILVGRHFGFDEFFWFVDYSGLLTAFTTAAFRVSLCLVSLAAR